MKKKLVLLFIGVLFMVESLVGCSGSHIEDRKAEAKALLEEKYGESFTVLEYNGEDGLNDYYTVTAYSDSYPDIIFSAAVETEDDKGISDNYGSKRVATTISNAFAEGLKELDENYFVYTEFTIADLPIDNPDMTIEEMEEGLISNSVIIRVFLDMECQYEDIKSAIATATNEVKGLKGLIRIYSCDSELIKEVSDYVSNNETIYYELERKIEEHEIQVCNFEDGVLKEA